MERTQPEPIELILYVGANSPKADEAVSKLRGVLGRFNSPKVKLTVCPISERAAPVTEQHPPEGAAPVRPNGSARTLILGHITHPEILLELLNDGDIEV